MNILWHHMTLLISREYLRVRDNLHDYMINNWLLWPLLFGISTGYFMATAYFGPDSALQATELVAGLGLLQMLILSFFIALAAIDERIGSHVMQYHVVTTSFRAMLCARYCFSVIFVWCNILPFYPVIKLLMGERLYTQQLSWLSLAAVLLLGTAMCVAYLFCWSAIINNMKKIGDMWELGIEPLIWLGGMWVPGYAMAKGVTGGWLVYLNPFLYATEALRQLFFHDARFASLTKSCTIMAASTICFLAIAYILLKRRLDCVT